ncbi:MAG: hypothetical protein ACLT8C_00340 [Akkermansia muciniphila]
MNIINLFFCITLLMFFSSCQREDESREAGFPGETVPEVSVMTVHGAQVPVTANLPGRMEAILAGARRGRDYSGRCYQRADGPARIFLK